MTGVQTCALPICCSPLGSPLLWVAPIILIALLVWALVSGLGGYYSIDTSEGLAILRDQAGTVKSVTVIDGNQRVELELTESPNCLPNAARSAAAPRETPRPPTVTGYPRNG